MTDTHVAAVRRFNLSYTQRIGALDESFLGTGRPLGQARLLHEIGSRERGGKGAAQDEAGVDGVLAQDLRERLGLDSGYLSRLLRALTADGLLDLAPDSEDRRRRRIRLTAAGRRAWQDLENRSEERAGVLLEPLTGRQRTRLAEALDTAELLIRAATVRLETVDPASPAARAAVRTYLDELDARFPEHDAPPMPTPQDENAFRPPAGAFVLAISDGSAVAGGGWRDHDGAAEIKRMWVDAGWRGAGMGRRLLEHLEGLARAQGYRLARLDTNAALTEAIALYERAGYRRIERYNDNPHATHFYEKPLA
ncbi:bifunctional helix-turn-helix transcriptional regulator/GNAT family N-acetyltransferase [Sediminivirga luteola]|uniref:bifunctional helix-turn-helix transcriptional regulator/GNAT family N-acetyltransferase n=1 Tax=Sediminivirga luteola TaxID=1774748 RepID=UPI0016691F3C|nr:helix-turn-helix domain-containing GNAT family N-acetyltransferase [Sediminivirga luteola]